MLEDALKTPQRLIGMVQPCPGRNGGGEGLHTIGCAGRISQFSETEDGRYLITLSGVSRYRIVKECTGFTPYRRCEVDWTDFSADLGREQLDSGLERTALLELLSRYFKARNLSTDWDALEGADDELLINSLSMLLDFEPEDKQALLEAPCLVTRRETLITLIEFALRNGSHEDPLQ